MALLDRIKSLFTDQHDGDEKAEGAPADAQAPALHGRTQHDAAHRQREPAPERPSLVARIAEGLREVAGDRERHATSALDFIFGRRRSAQGASRGHTGASPFRSSADRKYRGFRLTGATDLSGETRSRDSSLLGGREEDDRSRDRGLTGSSLFGPAGESDAESNSRLF